METKCIPLEEGAINVQKTVGYSANHIRVMKFPVQKIDGGYVSPGDMAGECAYSDWSYSFLDIY